MGQIKRVADWEWTGANASLRRALELDPGNSEVLGLASGLPLSFGRFEEAMELNRRAIALDLLNATLRGDLAEVFFAIGRPEVAGVPFQQAFELVPGLSPNPEGFALFILAH